MQIKTIHSFLVHPDKGSETQSQIKGTPVENKGSLFSMLQKVFINAPTECKYDIAFNPDDSGSQKNICRDLIIQYTKSNNYDDGLKLAERLQLLTTRRSGLGLLFLMAGEHDGVNRFVMSRFPADNGILAEESRSTLSVQFVERIFMKNAKAYKSACYEDNSLDGGFWTGKAIDKQIKNELTISDYWIKEFLLSDFATTGERGTSRLAAALRNVINGSSSIETKQELTAVVRLAQNFDGEILSPRSLTTRLNLSQIAKEKLENELKPKVFNEQFKFMVSELNKQIPIRTIELDNGALLSAHANSFDEVFSRKNSEEGNVLFTTIGKVVDERVRKR